MGNFTIRKAEKEDAMHVSMLLLQLGYDTAYLDVQKMLSHYPSSNNAIYVYVLEGKILAVMSIIFFDYFPSAQKLCRITSIVVDENARGLGIGSKLINHAKLAALSEKCNVLEVTTSLQRQQTQKYYESIGFIKTSYKYVQKLSINKPIK